MQDYGGPVGFRMLLAHPERVDALIVQDAVAHNEGRPHQSLGPGIPDQVEQKSPTNCEVETISKERRIIAKSILGGLHHEYRWADAA